MRAARPDAAAFAAAFRGGVPRAREALATYMDARAKRGGARRDEALDATRARRRACGGPRACCRPRLHPRRGKRTPAPTPPPPLPHPARRRHWTWARRWRGASSSRALPRWRCCSPTWRAARPRRRARPRARGQRTPTPCRRSPTRRRARALGQLARRAQSWHPRSANAACEHPPPPSPSLATATSAHRPTPHQDVMLDLLHEWWGRESAALRARCAAQAAAALAAPEDAALQAEARAAARTPCRLAPARAGMPPCVGFGGPPLTRPGLSHPVPSRAPPLPRSLLPASVSPWSGLRPPWRRGPRPRSRPRSSCTSPCSPRPTCSRPRWARTLTGPPSRACSTRSPAAARACALLWPRPRSSKTRGRAPAARHARAPRAPRRGARPRRPAVARRREPRGRAPLGRAGRCATARPHGGDPQLGAGCRPSREHAARSSPCPRPPPS